MNCCQHIDDIGQFGRIVFESGQQNFPIGPMINRGQIGGNFPAILTVPLVVFILPSLFAVLLGPAVIKSLNAF